MTDDQTMDGLTFAMPYVHGRSDWVTFTGMIENSLCCPSRSAFFSGRYDVHNGVINNATGNRLNRKQTVFTWLAANGWDVGLYGKLLNTYSCSGQWPGVTDWQVVCPGRDQELYAQYGYRMNSNGAVVTYGSAPEDYQVDVLADLAIEKIKSTPLNKPLFLLFTPTSTHWPWVASPSRQGAFRHAVAPRYPSQNETDVSDKPRYIQRRELTDPSAQDRDRRKMWRGSISVDDAIKRIDDALKAAGRWDTTVEALWSDNGYAFGEHRWYGKRCEYEVCARVPMLLRVPGVAGRNDGRLMSNVDLTATLMDLARVKPGHALDGRSLVPVIKRTAGTWDDIVLQHWPGGGNLGSPLGDSNPGFWCVRSTQWRYCELATGEREMYNVVNDPYELTNLAGRSAYADQQRQLAERLQNMKPTNVPDVWIPWLDTPSSVGRAEPYVDLD